jgi:hypothetical protein
MLLYSVDHDPTAYLQSSTTQPVPPYLLGAHSKAPLSSVSKNLLDDLYPASTYSHPVWRPQLQFVPTSQPPLEHPLYSEHCLTLGRNSVSSLVFVGKVRHQILSLLKHAELVHAILPQRRYKTWLGSALMYQPMPIRFDVEGKIGMPLRDALDRDYRRLLKRDDPMFEGCTSSSISVRPEVRVFTDFH